MGTVYLCIVIFLLCLAVFDLFVGVSNDAVNFLQSAIGAKVAKFRTVLIIASFGVVLGAIMSSGMMDRPPWSHKSRPLHFRRSNDAIPCGHGNRRYCAGRVQHVWYANLYHRIAGI